MFKIEITESAKVQTTKREWVQVADKGNERDGGAVYAYGPEISAIETVRRTILLQEVDDLDLSAVIRAINKI